MGVGGARTVNNREMPNICLQHMMAVYLVDGGISFAAAHDYERFVDPAMLAIREKVELVGDDALVTPESPRQAVVEVTTTDGATYRDHVVAVRGTMENPMTTEEVEGKARDLLVPALGEEKADALIAAVRDLESLDDVRSLLGVRGGLRQAQGERRDCYACPIKGEGNHEGCPYDRPVRASRGRTGRANGLGGGRGTIKVGRQRHQSGLD